MSHSFNLEKKEIYKRVPNKDAITKKDYLISKPSF